MVSSSRDPNNFDPNPKNSFNDCLEKMNDGLHVELNHTNIVLSMALIKECSTKAHT